MKLITSLLPVIAVAGCICNDASASPVQDGSLQSPHIVGGVKPIYPYRPEVFHLRLYKNEELLQTCMGAELNIQTRGADRNSYYMWITAAECLDKDKYDQVVVEQMYNENLVQFSRDLSELQYHIHPDYNAETKENNIAVVTPNFNLYKDTKSTRVVLPDNNDENTNTNADIFLEWNDKTQKSEEEKLYELRAIRTKIINPTWCKLWYPFSAIKKNHVCVSGWYGKGLLKSDIGIPLVTAEDDYSFKLIGIATVIRPWTYWFGLPIEFSRITPDLLEWIQSLQ